MCKSTLPIVEISYKQYEKLSKKSYWTEVWHYGCCEEVLKNEFGKTPKHRYIYNPQLDKKKVI
jgi:hypothetical protein